MVNSQCKICIITCSNNGNCLHEQRASASTGDGLSLRRDIKYMFERHFWHTISSSSSSNNSCSSTVVVVVVVVVVVM